MNCRLVISVLAFTVIFLSSLFLFMRNYPSDRWFSIVFVVASGVLVPTWWSSVRDDVPEKMKNDE
jgi:hypothetical protein